MSGARRFAPGGIAAVAAVLVAVSAFSVPSLGEAPAAAATSAPSGRIAYAGTGHRGLGEVTNPVNDQPQPSQPLFGGGPAHFDDDPAARGDMLVFTSLRDEAKPQVYLRDASGAVQRLTTGMDAAHPQLSPDRQLVAFDSGNAIWLAHIDGTGLRKLTDGTWPTFSPDGQRVAYSNAGQIFARPVAGGDATQITNGPGTASQPAWNPLNDDGHREQIAYVLQNNGTESLRLTPGNTVLSGDQAGWRSWSPAWQPDGNGLLFVSDTAEKFAQAYVIPCRCAGEKASLLLAENRAVDSPTWLVDKAGTHLVVAHTTQAGPNVASLQDIRPDGSDPRDLGTVVLTEDPLAATDNKYLFHPGPGFDPWTIRQTFSPDGRQLAASRFDGASEQIWLSDPDGSHAHLLPIADRKSGDWETDAEWSPDGTMIALARRSPGGVDRTGGPSRIIVVKVATGEIVTRIANNANVDDGQPAFSPDGKELAFSRGTTAAGPGEARDQHIMLTSMPALDQQRDLTAAVCAADCHITDDSPVFSPDGHTLVFNRETDGLLQITLADTSCRVLLPTGGSCAGLVAAPNGPFQPRDVAFSPDGKRMVLTTRRAADLNSAEMLTLFDPATGTLTPLTPAMPGRQKEPTWQANAHVTLAAPPSTPPLPVGSGTPVIAAVTDHGPAPSGATVTIAVPSGLRLEKLTPSQGHCDVAGLVCDLGVIPPNGTVTITATITGLVPGNQMLDWAVTGAVLDTTPGAGFAQTVVPVIAAPDAPPPPPPAPTATQPGISVVATPNPSYVGGRATVKYTATNSGNASVVGPRLSLGLPKEIPVAALPPGCTATECALPDLTPGASVVVQIVVAPATPGISTITTTLTGANGDPITALTTLRVLQPKIVAVPAIGKPGFVTSVRGTDFPPGVPVVLTWKPGITASAAPTKPGADGKFIAQLLILSKDETGPRTITATGPGFAPATTPFLVVAGTIGPPGMVTRH